MTYIYIYIYIYIYTYIFLIIIFFIKLEQHVLGRTDLHDIFLLANEQSKILQQHHLQWEILYDEIYIDNDHGRPLIQFVAQLRHK
jgi:hypothetical protein